MTNGVAVSASTIAVIVLYSASLLLYEVDAIAITSPTTQSTGSFSLIVELPASAVSYKTVQVGYLATPCMSRVASLRPIHLLP